MGIKAIGANPGYPAVQVTEFLPHSLADEAGLQVGDYIFAIDGVPTPKVAILAERVAALRPGERVRLRIGRSGRVFDLEVPLASRVVRQQNPATANQGNPAADYQGRSAAGQSPRSATEPALAQRTPAGQLPNIGAEIADVPGQRGAVVSGVQLGSIAASAGLKIDDRIVAVDGRMVYDMKSIVELLSAKKMGTTAAIRLIRDNELVDATLSFDPKAKQPADESGQAVSNDKGSILGGLGSVFGGMFSGKPLENEGGKPADALNAPSTEKDSEPNLAGKDPLELPPPTSPPAASDEAKKGPPNTRSTEEKSDDPETIKKEIQRLRDQLESLESKLEK
jgi:membrane-associated protease RseP (regulator of RpoE activity)